MTARTLANELKVFALKLLIMLGDGDEFGWLIILIFVMHTAPDFNNKLGLIISLDFCSMFQMEICAFAPGGHLFSGALEQSPTLT